MRAAADAEHAAQPHSQPKQWDATRLLNLQANHSVVVEGRDDGRVFFCALGAGDRLTAPEDISGTLNLLRLHASGDRLVVRDFTCPNTTPRAQSLRSSGVSSGGILSPSTILPARPRAARARGASGAVLRTLRRLAPRSPLASMRLLLRKAEATDADTSPLLLVASATCHLATYSSGARASSRLSLSPRS